MQQHARISAATATVLAGVIAFWGGWSRRWISDDGLIVLRTVRNLLAGNGPVFNIGERIEANTSTLWQYMITAFAWVTGGRLEDVATTLALTCTVLAAAIATYASSVYWQGVLKKAAPVIPFGILIYFALPPARDFATSGLEWGLALFWLAVWFALLVDWASPARRAKPSAGYLLAFWCGLSWLVRPEFALYGGVTGIALIAFTPRKTPGILAAALPLPAAYQLFRMGYYGLLTPHTAVAKSASDAEWASGWAYLRDFNDPYLLWIPLVIALLPLVAVVRRAEGRRRTVGLIIVGCALAHTLYVLRVGGDFMHGRMLLLPLFALLMPVMAVPYNRLVGVLGAAVAVWAFFVLVQQPSDDPDRFLNEDGELGIVDERDFWTMAVGRKQGDPPKYAEDFMSSPLMRTFDTTMEKALRDNDGEIAIAYISGEPLLYKWYSRPREEYQNSDLQYLAPTAYWINLGMTSMNSPLDARILDTVGLADPLAARMPRDPDGRVGHDKQLKAEWQVADSAVDLNALPDWFDAEEAKQARAALRTEEIGELLATSREPMSWERFWKNVRFSLGPGRTLELNEDPSGYLDAQTKRQIRNGADVGLKPVGKQIAWPRD
ncbi:hypothetical protein V6D40_08840 [Corynebacterium sp. Q4381]|uniref:hypothetical protein n=1 Tax=Corynebacterium sp. Marseille-Q4381 TaxID=3121597 RepID=UPI002FE6586E